MRVARRSEHYDRALAAVMSIVNAHDPTGLLGLGAPRDEYDPEVTELTRMVAGPDPITETDVRKVWVRWFGADGGSPTMEQLGTLTSDLRALQADLASR